MKRIVLAAIVCALLVVGASAETVPPEKKIVIVPGDEAWTATGIRLAPGDRVTITATGKVCFSAGDRYSCVGPEGMDRAGFARDFTVDLAECDDPVMDARHAALLAEINGERIVIGTKATLTNKDGLLFLGPNDCSFTSLCYNTGQLSVVVKVERGPVPHD